MIDEVSHAHIVKLCSSAKLDRKTLGEDELTLLETLDRLGVAARTSNQFIELDSTINLLELKQIQSQIGDGDIVGNFEWQYRLLTESTNCSYSSSGSGISPRSDK